MEHRDHIHNVCTKHTRSPGTPQYIFIHIRICVIHFYSSVEISMDLCKLFVEKLCDELDGMGYYTGSALLYVWSNNDYIIKAKFISRFMYAMYEQKCNTQKVSILGSYTVHSPIFLMSDLSSIEINFHVISRVPDVDFPFLCHFTNIFSIWIKLFEGRVEKYYIWDTLKDFFLLNDSFFEKNFHLSIY